MDEARDPRLVSDDTAVVDVSAREIIRAKGGDRIAFLHRLLTSDVTGLPVGGGGQGLLLNLKGHIVSHMCLFVLPDEVRLVVGPGQGEETAAALARYSIMDDFTPTVDSSLRLLALFGPRTAERLAAAGLPLPDGFLDRPAWSHETLAGESGTWVVRADGFGDRGIWIFGGERELAALSDRLAALGVRRLAHETAEALRIQTGEPRAGAEITPDYFPMEIGLDAAIDYGKGCYLGQEPIVRIRDRGHINWRLALLRVEGDVTPAPGDTLTSEIKPRAGKITSAARLPGAAPVALGLVHVSVPGGSKVSIQHGGAELAATVAELPA